MRQRRIGGDHLGAGDVDAGVGLLLDGDVDVLDLLDRLVAVDRRIDQRVIEKQHRFLRRACARRARCRRTCRRTRHWRREPDNVSALLKAAGDDYRLVRVRAAAALAGLPEEGLTGEQRRRVQDATVELMDSMKSRPDDMASHYNLGNFHMERGQMAEAATEFEIATRLQPEVLPPYVNAALAYNALGQNDKAEASLRHALSLDATNAAANLNLGLLLAEMCKMSGAEQAFRAAFKADPQSAQAAYNLGVLLSNNHSEEALDWCRRAAELGPDNPQYGYTYAFYLHRAGRIDQALQVIHSVRKRHPEDKDSARFEQLLLQEKNASGEGK